MPARISARISRTSQTVMRGPKIRFGFGKRPVLTPAHQVERLTGIGPCGATICLIRRKPSAGSGIGSATTVSSDCFCLFTFTIRTSKKNAYRNSNSRVEINIYPCLRVIFERKPNRRHSLQMPHLGDALAPVSPQAYQHDTMPKSCFSSWRIGSFRLGIVVPSRASSSRPALPGREY